MSDNNLASPRTDEKTATPYLMALGFLRHRSGDLIKDRYEVLSLLGGGNFGSVYRVRDGAVGNVLACKEMHVLNHPETVHDERAAALELFRREALNLATLRHPHIPSAYFEQEDGHWKICPVCGFSFDGDACPDHGAALLQVHQRYYLMMDYVEGPTVEELAVSATEFGLPLDEKQCIEWMAQIGSALRSLHRVGIVHRDVKPDNIKIRRDDNAAFLLDFGLTKKAEEAGAYGTARLTGTGRFGTPGYAPPSRDEQNNPEPRSDIYALGMTLYRLLCGRDPQDETQLSEMREYSPRHFNASLSQNIERVIQSATATDKERRYQTIDALLADLEELRGGSQNYAPPFTYSDGSRARTAEELARLIETYPEESLPYLWNGMFATWLRQTGYAAPARAASDIVRDHTKAPLRALEAFRRALYPKGTSGIAPQLKIAPPTISFGTIHSGETQTRTLKIENIGTGMAWGTIAAAPRVLAPGAADDDAGSSALKPLPGLNFPEDYEGNAAEIALTLDTSQVAIGAYSGALEVRCADAIYRVAVDYTVAPLQLQLVPEQIDFGTILIGRRAEQSFRVREKPGASTRGTPRGVIYTGGNLYGVEVAPRFENDALVSVKVDATSPNLVARDYEGSLILDSNGGRLRLPLRYTLALPPSRWAQIIASSTAIGLLGGAVLRLLYVIVDADYVRLWLARGNDFRSFNTGDFRAPVLAGVLLGIGVAVWLLPRLLEDRSRKLTPAQIVGQTLPLCALLGAALCWPAVWLLHWCLWVPLDWMLHPPALLLGRHVFGGRIPSPPLMWAGTGALIGALWGTARALTAIGVAAARYVVIGVYIAAFFALLLWAMLSV